MVIPTNEIRRLANNLIDLSNRLSALCDRADSVGESIADCYEQGGVGDRAAEAASHMRAVKDRLLKKGGILHETVNIYTETEKQLVEKSGSTANTILQGFNVAWACSPLMRSILAVYLVLNPVIGPIINPILVDIINNERDTTQDSAKVSELSEEERQEAQALADDLIRIEKEERLRRELQKFGEDADINDIFNIINNCDKNPYKDNYDLIQCTRVAWALLYYLGWDIPHESWHDAKNWFSEAEKAGMETGPDPKVGAIYCEDATKDNPYGHVAVVVKVYDDGSFDVIDGGAKNGYRGVRKKPRHTKQPHSPGFIYPKPR